jgi:hypothetical protein
MEAGANSRGTCLWHREFPDFRACRYTIKGGLSPPRGDFLDGDGRPRKPQAAGFSRHLPGQKPMRLIAAHSDAILRQVKRQRIEPIMSLAQYAENGLFAPRKIAAAFRTTSDEVARTAGLGKDAIQRKDRVQSVRTQRRLREMVEVINKVEPRFGSALMAYAWYRSEPLAGFSGQTAMQLVRNGRGGDVLEYIDAVDAGVHA